MKSVDNQWFCESYLDGLSAKEWTTTRLSEVKAKSMLKDDENSERMLIDFQKHSTKPPIRNV